EFRRVLLGSVDQDGGGGAAVLRAVVDAGKHDQGGGRVRELIGDGQQHGDGRQRADAGQHADRGAEEAPDEAVHQILESRRGGEAESKVLEYFHYVSPLLSGSGTVARPRTAGSAP